MPSGRAGRMDADGQQDRMMGHMRDGLGDKLLKRLQLGHVMIRWGHQTDGIRILVPDPLHGCSDTGGRITTARFGPDLIRGQFGQLLGDQISVADSRYHAEISLGYQTGKTVESHLQERSACMQGIQELLGTCFLAERPQSGADTTRHDDAIMIL